jgi:hypothetical protein
MSLSSLETREETAVPEETDVTFADEPAIVGGECREVPRANPKRSERVAIRSLPRIKQQLKKVHPYANLTLFRGLFFFLYQFLRTAATAIWWLVCTGLSYVRYHTTHALFTALLFGLMFLLLATGSEIHDRFILSQISDNTVDEIIDASRFVHNFQADDTRASTDFMRVGGPRWVQREGVRAILFAARKAGLPLADQAVLLATAEVESGFNPMAHAPSTSACGLFQFIKDTGKAFGLNPEDCMDPNLNAAAGVQHYLSLSDKVQSKLSGVDGPERLFKTFELSYYLHHDGVNSSNPENDVKAVVLSGVQFLLHVEGALQREEASKEHKPTFTQAFADRLWETVSPYIKTANAAPVESVASR